MQSSSLTGWSLLLLCKEGWPSFLGKKFFRSIITLKNRSFIMLSSWRFNWCWQWLIQHNDGLNKIELYLSYFIIGSLDWYNSSFCIDLPSSVLSKTALPSEYSNMTSREELKQEECIHVFKSTSWKLDMPLPLLSVDSSSSHVMTPCCRGRSEMSSLFCLAMLVAQSCPTLRNPMNWVLPGFSVHGMGLPFLSPGDLPDPGIKLRSPELQADSLLSELPGKLLLGHLSS